MNKLSIAVAAVLCSCVLEVAAADAEAERTVDQRLDRLEQNWSRLEQQLAELRTALSALATAQAAGGAPPVDAAAQAAVAQRLTAIEAHADALQSEVGEIKTMQQSQADVIAAASEADARALSLSSYGYFVAEDRSTANSKFDAESFEIVLSAQPHPRVGFFSELEFERAATVGGPRGGEVLVEQAYVDFSLNDSLALRSGVVLMPFGNVAAEHFAPLRDMVNRPLSTFALAPQDWTDNGFGLVGDVDLSENWHFAYQTYLVSGLGAEISDAGLRRARQPFGVDNNSDKSLVGHFGFSYANDLQFGLSGYHGAYDDRGNRSLDGVALDWNWNSAPFKLTGELISLRADRGQGGDAKYWGGYARVGYDLASLLPGFFSSESFPDAKFNLFYQYDYVETGSLDRALAGRREWRHTLGVKYEPTGSLSFKLNYEVSRSGPVPILDGDSHALLAAIGYVF